MSAESLAVITGGSNGIGLATAQALGRRGWQVLICSRTESPGRRAEATLVDEGIAARWLCADVCDVGQIEAIADAASGEAAPLRAWINNAGRPLVKDSMTISVEEWDDVFRTNVRSAFFGAQAAARVMMEKSGGVIVNVSSIHGHIGSPGRVAYTSSKHALEGMTKALAVEWARRGVRVISIAPGYIETDLLRVAATSGGFNLDQVAQRVPMGRIGEVAEVGNAIAALCSPEMQYVNGASLVLDGGFSAHGSFEVLG